ncbi:hypothetical protein NE237_009972 [Protea cynaroides]|uniref:Ubiquinol-cytochrome c reductase complex 6.7 kDa protein n=1 Tax=Protea cynaroides TaxID=273540 RepID=A0A9Q0KYF0_9MAGN|nr:hypothetical protein NE237_009972 [Protea cynaroides]
MPAVSASTSGALKSLRPGLRLQSTDIEAAAMWGVAAFTGALYLVQPFDWIRKTFFEKSEEK